MLLVNANKHYVHFLLHLQHQTLFAPQDALDVSQVCAVLRAADQVGLGTASAVIRET